MAHSTNTAALWQQYHAFQSRGLQLDLSRGKPERGQLELSVPMLHTTDDGNFCCETGMDTRNYGAPEGIPEARRLFGEILGMPADQVLVGGNSSVNLIYDVLSRAMLRGPLPGDTPWAKLPRVRFLCPAPGYDWHFYMLQTLGIEPVYVPMNEDGPDMDLVEQLVQDNSVRGLICVPMYSNPTGITFSDAVVDRLARMETAAPDFRILWDNAYCVHHLYEDRRDHLKNIYDACCAAGHPDRPILFTSTSKITFAGAGVSAMAGSPANMAFQLELLSHQMVCYDKLNQLRHVRFLPNLAAVEAHMARHAAILRPKFQLIDEVLTRELGDIAHWSRPNGGYFICFYGPKGCARRTVELCKKAGVTLTPAGAPFPYGQDPDDRVLRIAPTLPPLSELEQVMELFPIAVRLAAEEISR
jgi:DNA-binding transcriptional MocR family regulator